MNFNRLIKVAALLSVLACSISCGTKPAAEYYMAKGSAQGSTYNISYQQPSGDVDIARGIDSILKAFDLSLSNYNPQSLISRLNAGDTSAITDPWFWRFYRDSQRAYQASEGSFDITVAPICNYWGFGYTAERETDTAALDSLRRLVGMGKLAPDSPYVHLPVGMSLISNAIAQGLSVDIVAEYFESLGIANYLVEIGGELRTRGVNQSGKVWTVGIDKPIDTLTERELQTAVRLENRSLATSGNYRKFYEKDGVKYSHTIDPHTGYPVRHALLSATVIAPSCSMADAYATACMVRGMDWSKALAQKDPTIEVFLIYSGVSGELLTYASDGFPTSVLDK